MKIMCSCFFSLFESLSCFFIVCGVQQKLTSTRAHKKINSLPNFRLTSCPPQILSTFKSLSNFLFQLRRMSKRQVPLVVQNAMSLLQRSLWGTGPRSIFWLNWLTLDSWNVSSSRQASWTTAPSWSEMLHQLRRQQQSRSFLSNCEQKHS